MIAPETPEERRQLSHLTAPLGHPGSGRLRYAAAMYFNRRGRLSDAALEVYRICSPLDREDPAPVLAERGLAAEVPAPLPLPPAQAVQALVNEADRYLAGLDSRPGVAEVRTGIARARGPAPAPQAAALHPVAGAWLGPALEALHLSHPALAEAIAAAAPHLRWLAYDGYPEAEIGAGFAEGHCYASLIGADAPLAGEDFDFGLFLIAPHLLYRDHAHPAPELYAPLTGPHGWRFSPGGPLTLKEAHEPVWNEPETPHLTKVGPLPFLALYGWTRDAEAPASVVPASDWAELEALCLG